MANEVAWAAAQRSEQDAGVCKHLPAAQLHEGCPTYEPRLHGWYAAACRDMWTAG